jgi:hypothetical protein
MRLLDARLERRKLLDVAIPRIITNLAIMKVPAIVVPSDEEIKIITLGDDDKAIMKYHRQYVSAR